MDSTEETAETAARVAEEPPSPQRANLQAMTSPTPMRPLEPIHGTRPGPRLTETDNKRLIVGRDITLTGNIGSCDKIVVEGHVEAELTACREIEITASGTFTGDAEVEKAVISGKFDGTLIVRNVLSVQSGGRVKGTVKCGKLEVEFGGEIIGSIGIWAEKQN